ncbi:MAG: polymerase sigma-54 factor [Pseudomonadota bacterium]|jgi:RNA polymerase sigma-54 factor
MKASLNLRFSQNLALTPQLQQSIKLLQLSAMELEQELIQAAEQNPLIEYESATELAPTEPLQQLSHRQSSSSKNNADWDENDDKFAKVAASESLLDHLLGQIRVMRLSPQEKALMGLLAGNLDNRGYLAIELSELAQEYAQYMDPEDGTADEQVNRALVRLQHLDPSGVGARDLSECLRLQLEHRDHNNPSEKIWSNAHKICADYLENVGARDWARLKKLLKITDAELNESVQLIKSLQHDPAAQFGQSIDSTLVPDVIVKNHKGKWQVALNPASTPKININEEYAKVIRENKGHEDIGGIQQKLQEARWLVKNVLQRSETILKVAKAIVDRQQNFFNHGEIAMRPLVLREIADTLGLHESTISRVTTQKYMATPSGCFEFKYFFGSQVSTDNGGSVSSMAIRALIKQLVDEENTQKPLSDTQIVELLATKGFVVARRTIAKYRESLRIPAVHLRRK